MMQAIARGATMAGTYSSAPLRSARGTANKALQSRVNSLTGAPVRKAAIQQLNLNRSRSFICAAAAEDVTESDGAAAPEPLPTAAIEMRVGKILSAEAHPDADSLYVETIDVGEEEPRTIISGLAKYVELESLQGRPVVVLCNLKPRNMRGIKSFGMLLCASDEAHENVEPLMPPEGAAVGERIFFGEGGESQPDAESANKVQKKKLWEAVQPELKTDAEGVANFKGITMLTSEGAIKAPTLTGANIS